MCVSLFYLLNMFFLKKKPKVKDQKRGFKSLNSCFKCDVKINKLMLHGKYIVMYTYLK